MLSTNTLSLHLITLLSCLGLSAAVPLTNKSDAELLLQALLPNPLPNDGTCVGPISPVYIGSNVTLGYLVDKDLRNENETSLSFSWHSNVSTFSPMSYGRNSSKKISGLYLDEYYMDPCKFAPNVTYDLWVLNYTDIPVPNVSSLYWETVPKCYGIEVLQTNLSPRCEGQQYWDRDLMSGGPKALGVSITATALAVTAFWALH